MATTKQTGECNVRPAIAGNVRQSPGRTYLYLVKKQMKIVLLLCQSSFFFSRVVSWMSTNSGQKGPTVKWWPSNNNNNNQTSFFFFSSIFPSLLKGVDDYRSSSMYTQLAGASIRSFYNPPEDRSPTAPHEWKRFLLQQREKTKWKGDLHRFKRLVRFRFQPSFHPTSLLWLLLLLQLLL